MKLITRLVCIFATFVTMSSHAQTIMFAEQQSLQSEVLGENRRFYVHLPPSYTDIQRSFPVIYVLDGDIHRLKAIAGMLEGLSTETLESQVQEAIVVAIPSSDKYVRERDLTPTNVNWTFNDQLLEEFDEIGNAGNYLKFFKEELKPAIKAKYRTTESALLIGESFGGLFASYVLLNEPTLFSDYLIIDATYLWDNDYLNRSFACSVLLKSNPVADVFTTFANNKAFGEIGATNLQWGKSFFAKLNSHSSDVFTVQQRYFENESHGTVAM